MLEVKPPVSVAIRPPKVAETALTFKKYVNSISETIIRKQEIVGCISFAIIIGVV